MRIKKYICPGCGKEHTQKMYENKSEGVADIFTEIYFPSIWRKKKDQAKQMALREFCKELMFIAVYNYHKNRKRIRVKTDWIEEQKPTEDKR